MKKILLLFTILIIMYISYSISVNFKEDNLKSNYNKELSINSKIVNDDRNKEKSRVQKLIEISEAANKSNNKSTEENILEFFPKSIFETEIEYKDSSWVNVKDFKAEGNGNSNDTTAIQKAVNTGKNVYFPEGLYIVDKLHTSKNNQIFSGEGTIKGNKSGTTLMIKHNNITVQGLTFEGGRATYSIQVDKLASKVEITNNKFKGEIGHWILIQGNNSNISYNTLYGKSFLQTSPIVFSGAKNFSCSHNTFLNVTGFNIQTRWSQNGIFFNNDFKNPVYKKQIVSNNKKYFKFTLREKISRKAVLINGEVLRNDNNYTIDDSNAPTYVVEFTKPVKDGDVVEFIGFRSLENFNINSQSNNITVVNNKIDGTGDSAIVIGSDYHNRNLDEPHTDFKDYPSEITVAGNNIRNSAYAGVAINNDIHNVSVGYNTIADGGLSSADIYSAGIYVTGSQKYVFNNKIKNTEKGLTKYGISHSASVGNNSSRVSMIFEKNSFENMREQNYYIPGSSDVRYRKTDIAVIDKKKINYPATPDFTGVWENTPNDTPWFSYSYQGGTGWSKDNVHVHKKLASIKTYPSEFGQVALSAKSLVKESIFEVSFRAKGQLKGDEAYAQLFYEFQGDDPEPNYKIELGNSEEWKEYKMSMVVNKIPKSLFLRIGGVRGHVNIEDLKFNYIPIN